MAFVFIRDRAKTLVRRAAPLLACGLVCSCWARHEPEDAASRDAGFDGRVGPADAGVDGGRRDAGVDAGVDAGFDAGTSWCLDGGPSGDWICGLDCTERSVRACDHDAGPCASYNCCNPLPPGPLPATPWWVAEPPAECLTDFRRTPAGQRPDAYDYCEVVGREERFRPFLCGLPPGNLVCVDAGECICGEGATRCGGVLTQTCAGDADCPRGLRCSADEGNYGYCVDACETDADCLLCRTECQPTGICLARDLPIVGPPCTRDCECIQHGYGYCSAGTCSGTGPPRPVVFCTCGGCLCRGGTCDGGCCYAPDGHVIESRDDPQWDAVCEGA